MPNICDTTLARDFRFDCENPPKAGLENIALLINWDDVDREASQVTNNIISSLVLKTGKKANVVEQKQKSFNGTKVDSVEGTYSNGFNHTFAFVVFDKSAEAKAAIDKMVNGKFIAVVQNQSSPDNAKYEVYGWHSGLSKPTITKDSVSEEGDACYVITLASEKEARLPMSFFKTDLASTKQAFEALQSVAS